MSIWVSCKSRYVYVVYGMFFNTDFVGNTNIILICLIVSTIYVFIPVSGRVGKGLGAFHISGAYNAVKTTLALDG